MTPAGLAKTRGTGEGLEHLLAGAVRRSGSLEGLYAAMKSKRYAHARLRRYAGRGAGLYIGSAAPAPLPAGAGASERGLELLRGLPCLPTPRWRGWKKERGLRCCGGGPRGGGGSGGAVPPRAAAVRAELHPKAGPALRRGAAAEQMDKTCAAPVKQTVQFWACGQIAQERKPGFDRMNKGLAKNKRSCERNVKLLHFCLF